MTSLTFINLIQAGAATVGVLGAFLLWRTHAFRGVALLLALIALASVVNILEETGLTRDWYLVSPVFIMLFGPATLLAAKFAIGDGLDRRDYWHLAPVVPFLMFTTHVHMVIALGTVWRVVYTYVIVTMLFKYKQQLDQERSDSDEFSLSWLMWLLVLTTLINLIDLLRLNMQPFIPYGLNVLGQGINNFAWLVASMVLIYRFNLLTGLPLGSPLGLPPGSPSGHLDLTIEAKENDSKQDEFKSIFDNLNSLMLEHKWYLKPRLTLSDMSEFTGLQTRDISRSINLHANISFNDYVNQLRIQAVCGQLEAGSQHTLTDIAFECGFSSKASFNKVFKLVKGMTPTQYKTRLQS